MDNNAIIISNLPFFIIYFAILCPAIFLAIYVPLASLWQKEDKKHAFNMGKVDYTIRFKKAESALWVALIVYSPKFPERVTMAPTPDRMC